MSLPVMAASRVPNTATSYRFPPGSSFHPSEEELVCYYLVSKNSNLPRYGIDVIKEIDLYNYDPFDLPETACFPFGKGGRKKHWLCYVDRVDVQRRWRAAGSGYWKMRDRVRDVVTGGGAEVGRVVVGTRKRFVFYLANGSSAAARRTNWVMHEYGLIGHPQASFVLCRVFVKSDHRNNISDYESTPRGRKNVLTMPHIGGVQHESVAMVHHIGVQHDGAVIAEAKLLDDKAVDTANEVRKFPFGQASALEDRDISNPVAHQASFVLCRVLEKSDHRNNISDSESTPRGRKSVVTVRHIGIQHDGDAIAEAKLLEDNEILKLTFGEASASGDQNIGDPVAPQMKPLTDADWDARTNDVLSTQQLVAILEEDFLELDDLKCPLDGIN